MVLILGAFFIFAFSLRIDCKKWIYTKNSWSEGQTENLVWIWVANLVHLWFCYQVVVEISIPTFVPKMFLSTPGQESGLRGKNEKGSFTFKLNAYSIASVFFLLLCRMSVFWGHERQTVNCELWLQKRTCDKAISMNSALTLNCIRYPALPLVHNGGFHGTPQRKPLSHWNF